MDPPTHIPLASILPLPLPLPLYPYSCPYPCPDTPDQVDCSLVELPPTAAELKALEAKEAKDAAN